jgi:hypothetical protein
MTDPYEKPAKIARGEIDDEMPAYDELTQWMRLAPKKWLPGLLSRAVYSCVQAKVFADHSQMLANCKRWAELADHHVSEQIPRKPHEQEPGGGTQ